MNQPRTLNELAGWSSINYYTLATAARTGKLAASKSAGTWLSTRQAVTDYKKIAVFKPRRKKGMPKEVSKKLTGNIHAGLWTEANGIIASAWQEVCGWEDDGEFVIGFHQGEMPAHKSARYYTLRELEIAMRDFEPDLRRWKTT